ncbi:CBS domain-containing protein [Archaeoglobus profundus]|uniref:Transcriptional regulator, TrmB n=1 Tax=Archaeoglobus profundus (strain DSM 5631 / JCM 9629 / NBRC 100127 / Av18) TaxID=572546 RepID=D2RF63_ARCPA|nr:CBS domain-containing protein [Archaeoglobus profundus]ADB58757.1 transcriptional regulator, TrmB [Archaeoglobus profundus DSM 5631]
MVLGLTQVQKEILNALITLYRKKGLPVKGEEISELINRNPGTVRNQMQALRALGLVEGAPGPKGGYRPTAKAFELLSITEPSKAVKVPVIVNGKLMEDLSAEELTFPSLPHPEVCEARVRMVGDIRKIPPDAEIIIGPTPVNEMLVFGKVTGRDDTENIVIMSVQKIYAIPKDTVGMHMSTPIITVNADDDIVSASKVLLNHQIHRAPAKKGEDFIGIFSLRNAVQAFIEGKKDAKVREYMDPTIVKVEKDTKLSEALRLMRDYNVRLIVVTDEGKPVGVITDYQILTRLAPEQVSYKSS